MTLGSNPSVTTMKREPENNRCVHTEHCCVVHGCKYGDNCPVELGKKRQSYLCEDCYGFMEFDYEKQDRLEMMVERKFNRINLIVTQHKKDKLDLNCDAIFGILEDLDLKEKIATLEQCIDYLRIDNEEY